MIELPDNPAPKWQLERVMKLIKESIEDAKSEFCIFDEGDLYRGTIIALNDKGYEFQRNAEGRTIIKADPAPRLQMEKVAKLLQATIDAGLSYCLIDQELFTSTKNALYKKGYKYETNEEGITCIALYPKAINAWLESNTVERLRTNIE